MTGFVVLFLLFDSAIHIMNLPFVQEASVGLGIPVGLSPVIGTIELICLVLYLYPMTSVLGAILLTGYLGGAVLANFRVGYSLFGNVLFPVYVGVLIWGGLYLRNSKLRELIPFVIITKS